MGMVLAWIGLGFATLVWASLCLFAWKVGIPLLRQFLRDRDDDRRRVTEIELRKVELDEDAARSRTESLNKKNSALLADPIPVDLYQEAMQWPDAWAREGAVKALRDLYSEVGSWDNVRTVRGASE